MNATVYLFGKFNQEYFQYPNDYTQEIFAKMSSYATAKTQICIHRQRELMYYAYIQRIDNTDSDYIGLCLVVNDLFVDDIVSLFSMFENTFSNIVMQGDVLGFSDQGVVVVRMNPKNLKSEEVGLITRWLEESARRIGDRTRKLPPVKNGISSSEVKKFLFDNLNLEKNEIIESSWIYGYTCIFKDKDYEASVFSNYKNIIVRLNKEKTDEIHQKKELQEKYEKVLKQKKQSNVVTFLSISMALLFVGLLISNSKNIEKNDIISNKENAILAKDEVILDKNDSIRILSKLILSLHESNSELKQELLEQRKINSEWKYYSDSLWNANLMMKDELYYVRQQQSRTQRDNDQLKQQVVSLQRANTLLESRFESDANQNVSNINRSYRRAVIYSSAALLEKPMLSARRILDSINSNVVEIIDRFNNDFYYIQVGNIKGYLWRGWIVRFE